MRLKLASRRKSRLWYSRVNKRIKVIIYFVIRAPYCIFLWKSIETLIHISPLFDISPLDPRTWRLYWFFKHISLSVNDISFKKWYSPSKKMFSKSSVMFIFVTVKFTSSTEDTSEIILYGSFNSEQMQLRGICTPGHTYSDIQISAWLRNTLSSSSYTHRSRPVLVSFWVLQGLQKSIIICKPRGGVPTRKWNHLTKPPAFESKNELISSWLAPP